LAIVFGYLLCCSERPGEIDKNCFQLVSSSCNIKEKLIIPPAGSPATISKREKKLDHYHIRRKRNLKSNWARRLQNGGGGEISSRSCRQTHTACAHG
jgi:hypothetical protein